MKKKTKTKKSDAVKTGTETSSANSGALSNLLNKLRPSSTAPMSKLIPIKCMQTMLQNDFSELLMRKPARKAQLQSIGTERETRITCILFAVKTKSCQSRSR